MNPQHFRDQSYAIVNFSHPFIKASFKFLMDGSLGKEIVSKCHIKKFDWKNYVNDAFWWNTRFLSHHFHHQVAASRIKS